MSGLVLLKEAGGDALLSDSDGAEETIIISDKCHHRLFQKNMLLYFFNRTAAAVGGTDLGEERRTSRAAESRWSALGRSPETWTREVQLSFWVK